MLAVGHARHPGAAQLAPRTTRSEVDARSRAPLGDAAAKATWAAVTGPRSIHRRSFCSGGPPTGRD